MNAALFPPPSRISGGTGRPGIVVGLINNMPDAALQPTCRQFARLLGGASEGLELRCYTVPEISRGTAARALIEQYYLPLQALRNEPPDALIITGACPVASELADEPYWNTLTALFDWSRLRRVPVVLSCLAAHAAVLHDDAVRRRRLTRKCAGVFVHALRGPHAVLNGDGDDCWMPHSRWNDVPEDALCDAGYRVLAASDEAGVGMFVHPQRPGAVYLQGHPEYEAATLLLEFKRDVGCFLNGVAATYPDLPRIELDDASAARFAAFRERAIRAPSPELMADFPMAAGMATAPWHGFARAVFANWLLHVRESVA